MKNKLEFLLHKCKHDIKGKPSPLLIRESKEHIGDFRGLHMLQTFYKLDPQIMNGTSVTGYLAELSHWAGTRPFLTNYTAISRNLCSSIRKFYIDNYPKSDHCPNVLL